MFAAFVIATTLALIIVALFTATFRPAASGTDVLAQLGLADRPELLALAEHTERRVRRIRRLGALAGLLVGAWAAHGRHGSIGNSLAAPWIGYLGGVLAAELTLRLPRRATVRSASLTPRRIGQLSPPWWRIAATTSLVLTAVLAPMSRLGRHPTTSDSYSGSNGSCTTTATWPTLSQVGAISLVAVAGLIGLELLRWRLTSRPAAAESATALFEERRRQWVSRAADRTGLALALALLATLAYELADGLRSGTCDAWRRGVGISTSDLYTSQLAAFGRSALEPLALILLAASAALMAWAPRQLRRAASPQPGAVQ